MTCERFGRKQSWPNFKALFWHLPGGTEENHDKSQSWQLVSRPRFESRTSQIWRGVNHDIQYDGEVEDVSADESGSNTYTSKEELQTQIETVTFTYDIDKEKKWKIQVYHIAQNT
jgi:hypothetical protein